MNSSDLYWKWPVFHGSLGILRTRRMRFTVFFSSDRLERQYCKPVQMGHGLHLVGRPWGHAKCEWMPLVLDGFGWFWASKLEVSCSGNAVWQFESPLSDCCTRKGSLRTTRSIQGKLGGHAMPCHGIIWSFNVVHFVWEGQQKHVCHHVSHWETLPSCLVWTCVNGGPCSHSRLQNLRSSSFVLGDRVGQWARNLGAWHDTRTGGTRWDVLNLTTWWCWPSKGMQSDANMILINLWNSLNFHICISLNHFCGPYSCKMYQTNVVNSC